MIGTKTKDRHVTLRENIGKNSELSSYMEVGVIDKPIDASFMAWKTEVFHAMDNNITGYKQNFIPYTILLNGYGHFGFMRSMSESTEYDRTVRMATVAISRYEDAQKSYMLTNNVTKFKQFKSWLASARNRLKQKYWRTGYIVEFLYRMFFKNGSDDVNYLKSVNVTSRGFYISDSEIFFNVMNSFVNLVNCGAHNHWFELAPINKVRSRYEFVVSMPPHDIALNHLLNGDQVVYDNATTGINFDSGKIVTSGNDKNSMLQSLFDIISDARKNNTVVENDDFTCNLYDPLVYRLQQGPEDTALTGLGRVRRNNLNSNHNSIDDLFDSDRLRYTYLSRKGVVRFSDPDIIAHLVLAYPDFINHTQQFFQVPSIDSDGYLVIK